MKEKKTSQQLQIHNSHKMYAYWFVYFSFYHLPNSDFIFSQYKVYYMSEQDTIRC